MAVVAPFRGITYDMGRVGDISLVTAPPYDVITEEDRKRYCAAHPNNIVRLILGEKRKGDTDWDNRYTRAADLFRRWQTEGILVRAERPAIYLTSHTFYPLQGGQPLTRWGIVALVKIEDEDSGVILPHERTFSAHKDDRLRLMRACNAHLSQIFALYEDPANLALSFCKRHTESRPRFHFRFEDNSIHRMWEIRDEETIAMVSGFFSERTLYIADGHHRYETSKNYRNLMRTRYGRKIANRSYEFTLMYLCSMNDLGLRILSSHRLIKAQTPVGSADLAEKSRYFFEVERLELKSLIHEQDAELLTEALARRGARATALAIIGPGGKEAYLLRLKEGMEKSMGEDLHPTLKKLDVVVLSRLILQQGLHFTKEDMDDDQLIHYESNTPKALSSVRRGDYRMGLFLNPTRVEQVKEVADNRLVMPRKSTFFYPKVLSGLVLNKISPDESIRIP